MTLKEVYRNFLLQVQSIYPLSEATVITDWIFESTMNVTKPDLIKNPQQLISRSSLVQIDNYLEQILQHKPVQYVLGETWFCNMKLKINEHVLIPRPETEELVEWILSTDDKRQTTVKILDIGTGSGCIAIALKKNLSTAKVVALDVSEDALILAKQNAVAQYTFIDFIETDFLNEQDWKDLEMFDIIVSNPPYIPLHEKEKMSKHITDYEPSRALFVPDDEPLLFYKKIAAFGKDHLNYNGKIFVETHENLAQQTASLFRDLNYTYVDVKQDTFGKERMVMARY